jgi:hypothetical protein
MNLEIQQVGEHGEEVSEEFEYVIHDPDIGDHYLISIREDLKYGTPIFEVKGGLSLCRHEDFTIAREGVSIDLVGGDQGTRQNLRPDEPAVFVVNLKHTGFDRVYPVYRVRLVRSDMKGLTGKITLGGHGLETFLEYTNLVRNDGIKQELVIERSRTGYSVENVVLEMYSVCEDEFSRNAMPEEIIHDKVSVSASWRHECADVVIGQEGDSVISITTYDESVITVFNPNHQIHPWSSVKGHMALQYKVWTPHGGALAE